MWLYLQQPTSCPSLRTTLVVWPTIANIQYLDQFNPLILGLVQPTLAGSDTCPLIAKIPYLADFGPVQPTLLLGPIQPNMASSDTRPTRANIPYLAHFGGLIQPKFLLSLVLAKMTGSYIWLITASINVRPILANIPTWQSLAYTLTLSNLS